MDGSDISIARSTLPQVAAERLRTLIIEGALAGLFVDGGVTPHNNPALALYLMCTLKAYGLCWASNPSRLLMISVGTGAYRTPLTASQARRIRAIGLAIRALSTLIYDSENLVLTLMQWLGACPTPWAVNTEVGALIGDGPPGGKALRFVRYDVRVETRWIAEMLDLPASDGEQAVTAYERHAPEVALVLLDIVMPGLDARTTYDRLRAVRSDVRVLFTTGYAPSSTRLAELLQSGGVPVLEKPFTPQALAAKVRATIDAS